MDWPPTTPSWYELPIEVLYYFLPGLFVHAAFLILCLVGAFTLRKLKCRSISSDTVLKFNAIFYIVAMLVNGVWSCSIFGNYYWSVDYVSDFSPFYPIREGVITYSWGEEMTGGLKDGFSLKQLNSIWAAFASVTWGLAFLVTFMLSKVRRVKAAA